ncbi:tetraspanin-1-like isoform X2 [Tachysurus fulvidraco]|nr:tetraspanin-1-like isoform X2 [Tachysurus fulvidraco]
MAVGILIENNTNHALGLLDKIKDLPPKLANLTGAGYMLVAAGAVVIFIAILACYCTYSGNTNMNFYLIMAIMITIIFLFLLIRLQWWNRLHTNKGKVAKIIKDMYGRNDNVTNAWDETMNLFKCCGYNNYTDFTGSAFVSLTSQYPQFCCFTEAVQCDHARAKSEHVDGCIAALVTLVKNKSAVLLCLCIEVLMLRVGAIIFWPHIMQTQNHSQDRVII